MTLQEFRELAEDVYSAQEDPPVGKTHLGSSHPRLNSLLVRAMRERGMEVGDYPPVGTKNLRAFYRGFNWQGPNGKADELPANLRPWFWAGMSLGR